MKSRVLPALALATALGSTLFIAVQADAQQTAPRGVEDSGPSAREPMRRMSADDRAAYFDARIAAVKAGLKLTPDQEKLWPPVEDAVRDGARKLRTLAEQRSSMPRPTDPIDRMERVANADLARGEALHKIVDAAKPLYASLADDQKRRLPILMHGEGRARETMGERLRHWWRGDDAMSGSRHGMFERRDDDRPGRREREGRRFDAPDRERL